MQYFLQPRFLTKITLFFLFLALFSFIFVHNSKNKTENVTVIITDEDFSPNRVVITPGSTVTWVNKGERPHWPASNFHPTHNLYPEKGGCLGSKFDACQGLLKDESYSFKFDVEGKWPVHDHLFPGLVMTVEVTKHTDKEDDKYVIDKAGISLEDFRKLDNFKQVEAFRSMSKSDPENAWEFLKKAFIVNGQVVGNAHEFAHIVGNEAYRQMSLSAVRICDESFAFGCFHGVTEMMLLKEGVKKIKDIETGCLKFFPKEVSQNYSGCIHGAGHGIYTWESGNLNKALIDCDMFSAPYRGFCYDGVFMENSGELENFSFDADNPWKICTDLYEAYHSNCARYQSQVFLKVNYGKPNYLKLIGDSCAKGPTPLLQETCYKSLGFYVAQNSVGKVDLILNKCREVSDKEGVAICTTGAAIETIFQHYVDFKKNALALCGTVLESKREGCFININQMLQ